MNTLEDVKSEDSRPSTTESVDLYFPWFSAVIAIAVIGFLVISASPKLVKFYSIPEFLLFDVSRLTMMLFAGISFIFEIRYFHNNKTRYQNSIANLQQQLDSVWESKKKQQQRANVFSGHADKLKYFISEKLLESIEYDEKYLHFKGIAAEVRHNGVISYDKVITALNKAIEQQHKSAAKQKDSTEKSNPSRQSTEILSSYQVAIDAIRYLWDLLDLSTAENMGLHIGNQLIECEEHYYQLNLDSNKNFDVTQSIPSLPTFHPQIATLMTFAILFNEPEINNIISQSKIDDSVLEETFRFENEQFIIELFLTPDLLGNPNHIILLLENLIKNAQYFSQKNTYKQKTDRILVRLFPGDGYAHFEIFNRGPQISSEQQEQIFTLGYSTRRNKQHHGKGLGLFFASEIVKGYNGQIKIQNIDNIETTYIIKVNTADETITRNIDCRWIEGRMKAVAEGNSSWQNQLSISTSSPILSIEISSIDGADKFTSAEIDKKALFHWSDPAADYQPKWLFTLKPFKKEHKLMFKPLDISGVCFNIKLPTADSSLSEQPLEFD